MPATWPTWRNPARSTPPCWGFSGACKWRHTTMLMKPEETKGKLMTVFSLPVIVAALGYFVDIYDLVLFSIVRVPSLKALGLQGKELIDQGVFLLNMQMAG